MGASFLIIGRPGRLRDSLCTILASFPCVDTIKTAEEFDSGCQKAAQQQPSAVIVDGGDYLRGNCKVLKQLVVPSATCRCIIIVNTLEQMTQARSFGADAVLLQGFSTDALLGTLLALNVLQRPTAVNVSRDAPQITSPGGRHAQKI